MEFVCCQSNMNWTWHAHSHAAKLFSPMEKLKRRQERRRFGCCQLLSLVGRTRAQRTRSARNCKFCSNHPNCRAHRRKVNFCRVVDVLCLARPKFVPLLKPRVIRPVIKSFEFTWSCRTICVWWNRRGVRCSFGCCVTNHMKRLINGNQQSEKVFSQRTFFVSFLNALPARKRAKKQRVAKWTRQR